MVFVCLLTSLYVNRSGYSCIHFIQGRNISSEFIKMYILPSHQSHLHNIVPSIYFRDTSFQFKKFVTCSGIQCGVTVSVDFIHFGSLKNSSDCGFITSCWSRHTRNNLCTQNAYAWDTPKDLFAYLSYKLT